MDPNVYALACYLLAWKFEGDQYPCMETLAKTLAIETNIENFIKEVTKIEQKILIDIDFMVPTTTAY